MGTTSKDLAGQDAHPMPQEIVRPGFLLLAVALPLPAQKVPVVEKALPTGCGSCWSSGTMKPTVAGGWVAMSGARTNGWHDRHRAPFEHMMFKGTPTIGTTNYQRDSK